MPVLHSQIVPHADKQSIGVAVCDRPEGPFEPKGDRPLISTVSSITCSWPQLSSAEISDSLASCSLMREDPSTPPAVWTSQAAACSSGRTMAMPLGGSAGSGPSP